MAEKPTYLLIDSQVLPDVFLKVVRAKEMLARGKECKIGRAHV